MRHTALLVIDIQRGAFDGMRCTPIDQPDSLVANALDLVHAARAGGTPIVFVQHCDGASEVFEEGTSHWRLHEALTPQPDEKVMKKYASSAFEGTELSATLEALEVRELVLCGLQSEFCVSNTAKSALAKGFAVLIARDGHSTWPSGARSAGEIRETVNGELEAAGATLSSTVNLARSIRDARTKEYE